MEACTLSSLAWSTVHISRGEGWTVGWVELCGVEEVFGTNKNQGHGFVLPMILVNCAPREGQNFILDGCFLEGLLLKMMRSLSKIHNWSIIHIHKYTSMNMIWKTCVVPHHRIYSQLKTTCSIDIERVMNVGGIAVVELTTPVGYTSGGCVNAGDGTMGAGCWQDLKRADFRTCSIFAGRTWDPETHGSWLFARFFCVENQMDFWSFPEVLQY